MDRTAVITTKKQLTIPTLTFGEAQLKIGQRVLVEKFKEGVLVRPLTRVLQNLAGALKIPKRWRGKGLEAIILEAKREHFSPRPGK